MATNKTYKEEVDRILQSGDKIEAEIEQLYTRIQACEDAAKKNNKRSTPNIQGQHVINKSILDIQSYIVDEFLQRTLPEKRNSIKGNMASDFYGNNSFVKGVKKSIQDMTAIFDRNNNTYYDANAETYRAFLTLLRESAVLHMVHLYENSTKSSPYQTALAKTCAMMNDMEIYVDQMAKQKYFEDANNNTVAKSNYERARSNVSQVLSNLAVDISIWVEELRNIAKELDKN